MDDLVHRTQLSAGSTNTKRCAMPLTWWASRNRSVLRLFNFHLCFLQAQRFAVLRLSPISLLSGFSMLLPNHLSLSGFVQGLFPQAACAFSSSLQLLGPPCCIIYMLIGFQSRFCYVIGASGHAGYLSWCVVSGKCDL